MFEQLDSNSKFLHLLYDILLLPLGWPLLQRSVLNRLRVARSILGQIVSMLPLVFSPDLHIGIVVSAHKYKALLIRNFHINTKWYHNNILFTSGLYIDMGTTLSRCMWTVHDRIKYSHFEIMEL